MKKIEIIKTIASKARKSSILIIIVFCAVIIITSIIHSISHGIKNQIYDYTVSFYPHIRISTDTAKEAQSVYESIKDDKRLSILPIKRLMLNIENQYGDPLNNIFIYCIKDIENEYFESLIPNLCYDPDSAGIEYKLKKEILASLPEDTVLVDPFRQEVLPGIITGEKINHKLKLNANDSGFGRSILILKDDDKTQEFLNVGIINTGNALLSNICIIDNLYNLQSDYNTSIKHEIFIQFKNKNLDLALNDKDYFLRKHYDNIQDIVDLKKVHFWTDQESFMQIIDLSQRISRALNFISGSNLLLALIALFALISLIIQKHRKEISIFLSLGMKHMYIFSIFFGLAMILLAISIVISSLILIGINLYREILFQDIPFSFTFIILLKNIVSCLLISLVACIISYYLIAGGKKKLIINIFRGE